MLRWWCSRHSFRYKCISTMFHFIRRFTQAEGVCVSIDDSAPCSHVLPYEGPQQHHSIGSTIIPFRKIPPNAGRRDGPIISVFLLCPLVRSLLYNLPCACLPSSSPPLRLPPRTPPRCWPARRTSAPAPRTPCCSARAQTTRCSAPPRAVRRLPRSTSTPRQSAPSPARGTSRSLPRNAPPNVTAAARPTWRSACARRPSCCRACSTACRRRARTTR